MGCSRSRGPSTKTNAALVPVDDPSRLVDVAGGHGAFAMAMCRRHPGLEATVIDLLPPSAAVGRRIVAEEGCADRVSFREGDVFELGLGTGSTSFRSSTWCTTCRRNATASSAGWRAKHFARAATS